MDSNSLVSNHLRNKTQRIARLSLLAVLASSLAVPSHAETLQEALTKAYHNNPTLLAARAGQRATDESIAITKSQGLPNLSLQGGVQQNLVVPNFNFTSATQQANVGGRLTVPIYRGGAVANGMRAAYARIRAGQANLRSVESEVFTRIVAAYMDVIRDQAIVQFNRNNVAVLETNLAATRDRFEIGDLTRTDVAQSEARLALARGQMQGAEARLISSRENYVQLVGHAPVDLEEPPRLPNLPESVEQAVAMALDHNPNIKAAHQQMEASKRDISVANAQRLPSVSATINGSYTLTNSASTFVPPDSTSIQAGISVTFPIYQGGGASARVRQNIARASQAIETYIQTERQVVAQTRAAYASWQASAQVIAATQAAVRANALSLEGVRAENLVGTRSILDILNAEQEYLNAQVQLVTAERDNYVAAFAVLAAMGRAEARDLGIGENLLYDPVLNFRKANRQINDWSHGDRPQQLSTPTTSVPAADATVSEEIDMRGSSTASGAENSAAAVDASTDASNATDTETDTEADSGADKAM